MLEFVFFNHSPRQQFADFLRTRGIDVTDLDDDEAFGVGIPEDVDDDLMEDIEAHYDEMLQFDQQLAEAEADAPGHHAAGVVLNLASGEAVYARVNPVLLGRIMEILTPQELGELVNAIVDAVERPSTAPLCQPPDGAD